MQAVAPPFCAGRNKKPSFAKAAKEGDFARADALIEEANNYSMEAHHVHSELLAIYARGELEGGDILLTHAQDHMMCGALAKELISEIILLRKELHSA